MYGEDGEWARLFRLGQGYLGTEIQLVSREPTEYRTVDHWESRAAWMAFRQEHAAAYENLDRRAELVTQLEQLVEESTLPTDE